MAQESENKASNLPKLCEDISGLYSNEKFSDVAFLVAEKKIHAHKLILATRCRYFESLLFNGMLETSQSEIIIKEVSYESFSMLLNYLYTGTVVIDVANLDLTFEVLNLANQYLLEDLKVLIQAKLNEIVTLELACPFLNIATTFELEDLGESCCSIIDERADEVFSTDPFNHLTQTSLVKLLKRDTLLAPEIDIFSAVVEWCKINEDVGGLVVKNVRLSQMTVNEVLSVRDSNLVENEAILNALDEIVGAKPLTTESRIPLVIDDNVAIPKLKVQVISGNRIEDEEDDDIRSWLCHYIDDKNGITVRLDKPCKINYICLQLSGSGNLSKYYVEVSTDQKTWKMLVNYQNYPCRSFQHLYFPAITVRYIRVVGTYNTAFDNEFFMLFSEACYYKRSIPKIVDGIICPTSNVGTKEYGAAVIEGNGEDALLDNSKSTNHQIGSTGGIVIQLGQPYMISDIKLFLEGNRYYKYYVETSIDKRYWEIVADYRNKECRSYQSIKFDERPVVFIRIVGTYNSSYSSNSDNRLYCTRFECR